MANDNEITHPHVGRRTGPVEAAAASIMSALGTLGHAQGVGALATSIRIARFWGSYDGHSPTLQEVSSVLAPIFEGPEYNEMVVIKRIRFDALCEHHFLPFTGYAAIGYVPQGKVFGLSKSARVIDLFCKQPTMQERLTTQIAEALFELLQPKGLGVVLYDTMHSCMSLRGIKSHEATTTTSALRGVFMNEPETRAEFLALAGVS